MLGLNTPSTRFCATPTDPSRTAKSAPIRARKGAESDQDDGHCLVTIPQRELQALRDEAKAQDEALGILRGRLRDAEIRIPSPHRPPWQQPMPTKSLDELRGDATKPTKLMSSIHKAYDTEQPS